MQKKQCLSKSRVSQDLMIKFSAMKLFDRFRKSCLTRRFMNIFSFPSSSSSSKGSQQAAIMSSSGSGSVLPRRRSCDDPPKTCCNSNYNYYSSNSHYSEAIADCIEFLNKSHIDQAILPSPPITSD